MNLLKITFETDDSSSEDDPMFSPKKSSSSARSPEFKIPISKQESAVTQSKSARCPPAKLKYHFQPKPRAIGIRPYNLDCKVKLGRFFST